MRSATEHLEMTGKPRTRTLQDNSGKNHRVVNRALDATLSTTLQGGTAKDLIINAAVAGFGAAVQTPLSAVGKKHGAAVGTALKSRLSSSAIDVREAIALEGPQFAPPSNAGKTSHQEMGLTSNAGSSSRSVRLTRYFDALWVDFSHIIRWTNSKHPHRI